MRNSTTIAGWWTRAAAAVASVAIASGCSLFGGSSTSGSAGGDDDTESPSAGDPATSLRGCADGYTREQIEDTILITDELSDSAHEMIVCGGLVSAIVVALVEGIIELIQDPNRSTLPEQYRFDGEGNYRIEVGNARDLSMQVRFFRDQVLVTDNLFDLRSYLVDPRARVQSELRPDGLYLRIELEHAGPGPLVELLGFGAQPPNPIVLTGNDLASLGNGLRDLDVEATISLTDHPGMSTIRYDVASPRMLVRSLLSGAPMQLDMIDAAGQRLDLHQTLSVHTWTVDYVDGNIGALDGDIGFTVRGDRFDFDAMLHYPRAAYPQIALSCAP